MVAKIDHIVYAVPNLVKGCLSIEEMIGITPVYGGKHEHQGTHNALVKIGESCYLEVIAIDPGNDQVTAPRWMGVDDIYAPMITRWAIKSDDIGRDVLALIGENKALGDIKAGSRVTPDGNLLTWELSMPKATPTVEALPFLIDWKRSIHPTTGLKGGCHLLDITLKHPTPNSISNVIREFGLEIEVFLAEEIAIEITLDTPNGLIKL